MLYTLICMTHCMLYTFCRDLSCRVHVLLWTLALEFGLQDQYTSHCMCVCEREEVIDKRRE